MKAIKINLLTLLSLALCVFIAAPLQAQQETHDVEVKADDKKVIIITKKVDKNGNVTENIEEREIQGDSDVHILNLDGKSIDFDIDEEDGEYRIRIEKGDGSNENQVWEWSGNNAEMKDKLREQLEEHGIDWHDNHFSVKECEDGKDVNIWYNKAFGDLHEEHNGDDPFLGVTLSNTVEVTNENGEETVKSTSEQGAYLSSIIEGTAAEKAGLQKGDVITTIDGTTISDIDGLTSVLKTKKAGDAVSISYLRDGQAAQTTATLGKRSDHQSVKAHSFSHHFDNDFDFDFDFDDENMWRRDPCKVFIGVRVSASNKDEAKGVAILNIIDGTPAVESGFQAGDVITGIEGAPIRSFNELRTERDKYEPGETVSMSYMRDGQQMQTSVTFTECPQEMLEAPKKRKKTVIIKKKKKTEALEEEQEEENPFEKSEGGADVDFERVNLNLEEFRSFPNPSNGNFNVHFNAEQVPTTVRVIDVHGKEIFREDIEDFDGTYNKQIDLTNATRGTLLLSISQGERVFTEKIVLQ